MSINKRYVTTNNCSMLSVSTCKKNNLIMFAMLSSVSRNCKLNSIKYNWIKGIIHHIFIKMLSLLAFTCLFVAYLIFRSWILPFRPKEYQGNCRFYKCNREEKIHNNVTFSTIFHSNRLWLMLVSYCLQSRTITKQTNLSVWEWEMDIVHITSS